MGIFKIFVKQAQNEFESSVVKVWSDNSTEFRNTRVEEFCNDIGIKHEFSSTYTPQQNGVVERKNRTLITLARAMLDDYGISQRFWAEAMTPGAGSQDTSLYRAPLDTLLRRVRPQAVGWSWCGPHRPKRRSAKIHGAP